MWDLIVSVPDHCLSFYFSEKNNFFSTLKLRTKKKAFYLFVTHAEMIPVGTHIKVLLDNPPNTSSHCK